jgi:hypothetical protein
MGWDVNGPLPWTGKEEERLTGGSTLGEGFQ